MGNELRISSSMLARLPDKGTMTPGATARCGRGERPACRAAMSCADPVPAHPGPQWHTRPSQGAGMPYYPTAVPQ